MSMDRDDWLKHGWRQLLGDFFRSPIGESFDRTLHGISNLLSPETLADRMRALETESASHRRLDPTRPYPRPPGALVDPEAFEAACTRCGDCAFACPYGAIHTLGPQSGPLLDPNLDACRLCADFPCISACRDGALLPLEGGELPHFGTAVPLFEKCANHPDRRAGRAGTRLCRACEESCPVPGALTIRRGRPVIAEHCTGCGLCASACPEEPRALEIRWPSPSPAS